jgi:NitT/TauT family transport system permease protein
MVAVDGERSENVSAPVSPLPPERARWLAVLIDLAYPAVALALAIGAWALWVEVADIKSYLVPPPNDVFSEMWTRRSFLWDQSKTTALETGIGFAIAVAGGALMAAMIASFRVIERSLYPLLVASQVIPKVALAPIFLIWLGFGISSKVLVVVLISFFPVVVNGVIGLQSLEQEKIYLAQSMGASRWSMFWRIRFPQALPSFFGGIKLASIFAVVGAVVGEFIGAEKGLGRTLLQAQVRLNAELLFAAIGYLTIMGLFFYGLVDVIERLAIPWHISKRGNRSGN